MNTAWPNNQWSGPDTYLKQAGKTGELPIMPPKQINLGQNASGSIPYAALPTLPPTSHHFPHNKDQTSQAELPLKTKIERVVSPGLELVTAVTFLLNIPTVQKWLERIHQQTTALSPGLKRAVPLAKKSTPEVAALIRRIGNPRVSNLLLVSAVLFRAIFNTSIGINQQQASMVMTNVGALMLNIPLVLMMELATKKGGRASAIYYSKVLSLVNLSLAGLFATGFVQKSRHDIGKKHYNHDMRNLNEITDFKNRLTPSERIQRSAHELKSLAIDSMKSYQKAWAELQDSLSSWGNFKTTVNPLKPEGAPGRIAFSAFTMPLGALIALMNIKNHKKIALTAAGVSILGNLANGIALALTAWLDKDQPFRWLGVLGGIASPITEGILTSKNPLGPASMTTSNAFQNLYQATAWAHPGEAQKDTGNGNRKVYLNEGRLLPPP